MGILEDPPSGMPESSDNMSLPDPVRIPNRDLSIDTLRGLAIFTMVAANMAYLLPEPHPFWLRLYGSFAAPLFILLSGMMVGLTSHTKGHGVKYFALRGLLLITVGVFIDLSAGIYPFTSMDVLYLIGLSVPLAYLFQRLDRRIQSVVVILIYLVTPLLQKTLGYTEYPTEIALWGGQAPAVEHETSLVNHWFVDGWFPLCPWLGFSFLGVHLAKLRRDSQRRGPFGNPGLSLIGLGILAVGAMIWWRYPGRLLTRGGSSELFYPPTVGYLISAIGLIMVLFAMVDWGYSRIPYWAVPLQALGECSLLMYVLHAELIEYVIAPLWPALNMPTYLVIYLILACCLVMIAYGVRVVKRRWPTRPFLVRFLFGG